MKPLLIDYCVGNISAKNYQNLIIYVIVIVCNVCMYSFFRLNV